MHTSSVKSVSGFRFIIIGAIVLLMIVLISYWPASNAGYVWDDNDYVTENPVLRDVEGLKRLWLEPGSTPQYYPITFTTFWVEYQLWQLDPSGYHVDNILLHALNAILLWLILRRLGIRYAWFAAAVFAVHPVHVESVAWITERKNVLSGAFYLGALLAYLKYLNIEPRTTKPERKSPNRIFYAISLFLFILALLSKSVTASLPVIIGIVIWWKLGKISVRDMLLLVPMLVIGAGFGLHTAWLEKHQVGAQGNLWDFTIIERILIAGRVIWFYASKIIWPSNLVFIYPRWKIDAASTVQYLYPLGVISVIALLFTFRKRIGRGLLAAIGCFIVTLFPVLGFLNVYPMQYSFVADHFQYLASIAVIASVASLAAFLVNGKWKIMRYMLTGFFITAIAACGLGVRNGIPQYNNLETLWETTIRKNPQAAIAYNNLGEILLHRGDSDAALEHFHEAEKLTPNDVRVVVNLGAAYGQMGDYTRAERYFRQGVKLGPNLVEPHINLGILLMKQRVYEEAAQEFERVLKIDPNVEMAAEYLEEIEAIQAD